MAVELKVPSVGESITEVEVGEWLKSEGESVDRDEPVVELESDKATVELPAPAAGVVTEILKQTGDCVMPRKGIFARVIADGVVNRGDRIALLG